jgi:predicted ribonuclease YlaK
VFAVIPATVCVFPDTNIFLHYRALKEIDWPALLCAQELEIEIAPIVTRELEEKKSLHSSQKLRERADRSLRLLHQHLTNSGLRHGVTIRFLVKEPTDEIARSRGLNLRLGDDWLIGTILLYREEFPDSRCVIATGDLPMAVKAKHYGIDVITPD